MFAEQGHLGAMPATVCDGLWDTPASRHEAACASGSVAALAAMADLRSGNYDTALVLGVELEKTVPGDTAARHLGAAAWTGHEGADAKFLWPSMFANVADEYDRRYGLDETHLRAIAQLNFANARRNPNAQTREWTVPDPIGDDDATNPLIEGRLRRFDCSQMTDGGAGVVLVTDNYLRDHPDARPIARIAGWGHRTVGLGLQQKLDRAADDPYVLPHVRAAALDALRRAQATLDDLDGIEVHDCFTPSEYLAIDHIGLTGPGESWKAIENGEIEIGGRLPINPSGGLIGGGHPVGASGVRMLRRRGQTGQRRGRRVPGRGCENLRHPELRRQHRHHGQFRRQHNRRIVTWTSRSSVSSCRPCPKTTTTRTGPVRGGRRPASGTPTT